MVLVSRITLYFTLLYAKDNPKCERILPSRSSSFLVCCSMADCVKVAVRCRPMSNTEKGNNSQFCTTVSTGQVTAEEVSEKDIIGGVTSKEDHELMEQILAGN